MQRYIHIYIWLNSIFDLSLSIYSIINVYNDNNDDRLIVRTYTHTCMLSIYLLYIYLVTHIFYIAYACACATYI